MDLFDEAVSFALERHSGQTRKMSAVPYILHPMEVAAIVGSMTEDKEALAAAILHDTIEDTDTTVEEIREKFGKRVTLIILSDTEDKLVDRPPSDTWMERKESTLLILKNTKDIAVKMMWLGDKLSNMRSFASQYRKVGDKMWQGFNQKDPKKQEWYYRSIAEYLSELKEYDAYKEYVSLVECVFGGNTNEIR